MSLDTIQPQLSIVFPCSAVGHGHTLIINPLVYVTFTLIILSFLFCHFSDQAFKMEVIVGRIAPFSFLHTSLTCACVRVCMPFSPSKYALFFVDISSRGGFLPHDFALSFRFDKERKNSKFSNVHLHLYVLNMSSR